MSDSDSSPQRDDRHHRRSRSRSPVAPGCAGETPADREGRRLAEAVVPVRLPAGQPWAAFADTGLSTRGPALAEETAPAAQVASPAALPPEEAPGAQEAETAAPASRAAARNAAPARHQRGGWPRRGPRGPCREPLQTQRRAARVHKELRPLPRRAAPPPRPATLRPPARRGRGGRTPREARAPRRGPRQPQRRAGRAPSTAPTPTPDTSIPAPPSRTPPRPPSLRDGRGSSAPRHPSVRREASRCRS